MVLEHCLSITNHRFNHGKVQKKIVHSRPFMLSVTGCLAGETSTDDDNDIQGADDPSGTSSLLSPTIAMSFVPRIPFYNVFNTPLIFSTWYDTLQVIRGIL